MIICGASLIYDGYDVYNVCALFVCLQHCLAKIRLFDAQTMNPQRLEAQRLEAQRLEAQRVQDLLRICRVFD